MSAIYAASRGVLVWLGEDIPADIVAFTALAAYEEIEDDLEGEVMGTFFLHTFSEALKKMKGCACCNRQWPEGGPEGGATLVGRQWVSVIDGLLRKPYFSRLWVVQEVVSAGTYGRTTWIHCGTHFAKWEYLPRLCLYLARMTDRLEDSNSQDMTDRFDVCHEVFIRAIPSIFHCGQALEILALTSERQCHDPRDRIFALNAILALHTLETWQVDYTLDNGQVYRAFAEQCILHPWPQEGLGPSAPLALINTGNRGSSLLSAPSWVTPFGKKSVIAVNGSFLLMRGICFATITALGAETSSSWPWQSAHDFSIHAFTTWYSTCHKIAGDAFDSTTEFLNFLTCNLGEVPRNRSSHSLDNINEIEPILRLTTTSGYELDPILEAQNNQLLSSRIIPRSSQWFDDTNAIVPVLRRTSGYELDPILEAQNNQLLSNRIIPFMMSSQVDGLDRDRKIGDIVQDGRRDIGWLPKNANLGDRLCLFAGAPYPFVLRPLKNGHYTILGDAYLAKTTLVEALGGEVDRSLRKNDFGLSIQPCMDWNHDSPEMQQLIDKLEVIVLE
ncbi:hypothetical protein D0865_08373 [Hortaea werneckii]|uniref:Heterokaryon incompatibility domain-containing protein n=1 Tax=Hortaea werneckii TaxID=91943 RepID=A0A3M7C764_HORWE|nr:hypothetical protein D0865_08373 [Hortaea werneckii]